MLRNFYPLCNLEIVQRIGIPRMRAIVQTGAHSIQTALWISEHILLNLNYETELSPVAMNVFSFTVIHVLGVSRCTVVPLK